MADVINGNQPQPQLKITFIITNSTEDDINGIENTLKTSMEENFIEKPHQEGADRVASLEHHRQAARTERNKNFW